MKLFLMIAIVAVLVIVVLSLMRRRSRVTMIDRETMHDSDDAER